MSQSQEYLILWHWRESEGNPGSFGSKQYSTVNATNAERAITKARKELEEEYSFPKQDMVIDAVLRAGFEYTPMRQVG